MTQRRLATRARRVGAVAAAAAVLVIAGCTSSTSPQAATSVSVPPTTAVSTPTVPPSTSAAVSSAPTTPTSSTAATTTAPPTTTPPAPRSTCTSVSVRVIRGSASLGQEFAALQFTNTGSAPCLLVGYPTVTLLRQHKPIGQPSQPSSPHSSQRTLAPGDTAESRLHDYTNCQAPLSDEVRVVVPGSRIATTRPAQLRGCTLRVDRLGPPE